MHTAQYMPVQVVRLSPRDLQFERPAWFAAGASDTASSLTRFLPRVHSADLTNDPRVHGDCCLTKRLVAFRSVCVASALMCGLASASMSQTLMSKNMGTVQFAGLIAMTCSFVLSLLVFVILTVEIFHAYRLLTASSAGFDFAKSYYMNSDVVCMRHFAMTAFFANVPLLCFGVGCKVWAHISSMDQQDITGGILCCLLGVASCALWFVYYWHRTIFRTLHAGLREYNCALLSA
mmetsp:Transcript_108346/g.305512  ORF Transcript_108346/g.305512 Transcript_108346/m.305512 type:complete len:234 (+) Transcript_108346:95-796(+)